jgi:hypothetical protein
MAARAAGSVDVIEVFNAAYLEMPDFDGPAGFLAGLTDARVTGEYRDHPPRYPRRPPDL